MGRQQRIRAAAFGAVIAMALGACNRTEEAPVSETQTATPVQTTNQPTTVTGCLKAGEASGTFVLTAEKSTTGEQTATYNLNAAPDVQLSEHVGRQVEVTGIVNARQSVATRSTTEPAGQATGTSGTPTVSTATELAIRQLDVHQVRRLGGECSE